MGEEKKEEEEEDLSLAYAARGQANIARFSCVLFMLFLFKGKGTAGGIYICVLLPDASQDLPDIPWWATSTR